LVGNTKGNAAAIQVDLSQLDSPALYRSICRHSYVWKQNKFIAANKSKIACKLIERGLLGKSNYFFRVFDENIIHDLLSYGFSVFLLTAKAT